MALQLAISENPFLAALRTRARIVAAVMLRDMRTRFGRTHWQYLVAIGWPLSHLLGLVITFSVMNRMIPIGTDSIVFISTGALPYILCFYPARQSAIVFVQGRTVLNFPIVQTTDVIFARVLLEGLSACLVCIIFCFGLWGFDVDIIPQDIGQALTGVYAAIFLGVSLGVFMITITAILGMAGYISMVLGMVVLFLTSGVYLPTMAASEEALFWLSLNPLVHVVTWVRSAYFEMHTAVELDKSYVLLISSLFLFAGLSGERLFRGKILR
jgi:capsular polysaccharide transport system permease protein